MKLFSFLKLNFNYKKHRIFTILIVIAIIYSIYILRIINLTSIDTYRKNYFKNLNNFRRDILDRNGKLLATNVPVASIALRPNKIIDKNLAINSIIEIFPNLSRNKIEQYINSNKSFVWLKRAVDPEIGKMLHDKGIQGINLEIEHKRLYVYSNLLSHIIGYTDIDNNGLAGVEKYYNDFLINLNSSNNQNFNLNDNAQSNDSNLKNNYNLSPLQLSIDIDIQNIVSEELSQAMQDFNAKAGTCIVLDPNNGEVLAMVNKPDFDPHVMNDNNKESLFPTAWYGLYEVGSVFKTLLFAIALDSRSAKLNEVYDIKKFNIGKFLVKDYHYHEKKQSLPEIFINSSNIGLVMLASNIDQGIIKQYLKKFGIFNALKIELPEKVIPQYPKNNWEAITLATISYGYGISITPMHFAQSIVPIVNGGISFDATIIKDANNAKGVRILDADVSKNMNKLLRLVVSHGNAKKADVPGLVIGGKTGTAHKIKNKKYNDKMRVSSFIAVSPANAPRYLVYFLLDEPKGNSTSYGFTLRPSV